MAFWALVGTDIVDFYMIFRGIPWCSQALAGEDWVGGLGVANLEACPKWPKAIGSDKQIGQYGRSEAPGLF